MPMLECQRRIAFGRTELGSSELDMSGMHVE